jgi:sugar/nucleoside kinase (ribokinase family)
MTYDVFGMCNPLYDIQAEISDEMLAELSFAKGSMSLIDETQQDNLISQIYDYVVNAEAGGSGANTMIGLSLLGGSACYAGRVGDDEHGRLYLEGLRQKRVALGVAPGTGTTGISVILITPDAQRTLCTFLGVSRELSPADISLDALRDSRYLYVTGYLWDTESQKQTVLLAMREAHAAGVRVALSLSDPFCVHRHRQDFLRIIHEHVDLLFGNVEEAQALTDTSTPQDAIRATTPFCELAAVTMDAHGSLVRHGAQVIEIPSYPVQAVDTTGAGDMFAAGLLYGLTHNLSLERTGRLAAYVAALVVAKLGPRLDAVDLRGFEAFSTAD